MGGACEPTREKQHFQTGNLHVVSPLHPNDLNPFWRREFAILGVVPLRQIPPQLVAGISSADDIILSALFQLS
eukprot:scaffold264640_cov15-Tisochrysis_lutea.AAC.1